MATGLLEKTLAVNIVIRKQKDSLDKWPVSAFFQVINEIVPVDEIGAELHVPVIMLLLAMEKTTVTPTCYCFFQGFLNYFLLIFL